jgi:hypothetical protein
MSNNNIPKLLAIEPFNEAPDINSHTIKELLDYAEEKSGDKNTLLDFAELLWSAKCAVTSAIKMSTDPSLNFAALCGVFETIEVIVNEKLVAYKHTEISEIPFAANIEY